MENDPSTPNPHHPQPPRSLPKSPMIFFCTTINHHDSRQWREAVFDPEFWWFHTELHEWNWGEVNDSFPSLQWVKGHRTFALVTVFVVNRICSRSCDVTTVCVCTGVWREDEDRERERECVFGSFCAFRRELLVCDCTSGFFFFNYYHFFQWVCTSFSSFSSPMFFDGKQTPTLNPKAESLFCFFTLFCTWFL